VWGGAAAATALLLALALRPAPVAVDTVEVTRGRLAVTLDEEGETRVRERYVVSAPVAGRVLRIDLEPGDPVVAGETVLATFRPSDPALLDARSRAEAEARVRAARAALERSRAERDRAAAQLAFARSEQARIERLARDGILAADRLEQAELALSSADSALTAAQQAAASAGHELRAAEARLLEIAAGGGREGQPTLALRSPVDGVVLRRLRESEAVVPAGEPLLEVADPAALEIVADYLSADAVAMRPGMGVEIGAWGGEQPLRGRVRRVEPAGFMKVSALGVEEQRVNVILDFEDPRQAWEALGDGYRVEVRVVLWEGEELVKAPASALFRHGPGWAAFVVEAGRAALQPVEAGHRSDLEAEILAGLEPGARVVVHPPDELEDGARVAPRQPMG
jgi:HlyD family secretion protein